MLFSLLLHTLNCYLYIHKYNCMFLDVDKVNSIDNINNFLDWDFNKDKIMEYVT